jgi:non-ribosomal peptide synthetase component E (peptide arylation enzyme)
MQPGQALLDLECLQEFLLDHGFARFKLPERIQGFDKLPRNPLGKVQRFVLQEVVAKTIKQEAS